MSDDEKAIRELVDTWLRASAAGDRATVLSLIADDVVFLLPGRPPMHHAEFAAAQAAQQPFDIHGEADIQEINVFGDWAYCWNQLTVIIKPRDGSAPITRKGPVLSVLRKQNGRWVIARDANLLTVAS